MQSERDPIFVDNLLWLPSVVEELLEGEAVAVDIEGVNLCRDGRISIIQVCDAQGRVFLFDITKMGSDAFIDWPGRPSLRALFENPHLMKVIFDGRADADALWYIFGVQMCNVYCLQVLHALQFSRPEDKYVKGLQTCLNMSGVVPLEEQKRQEKLREEAKALYEPKRGGCYEVWEQRPLQPILLDYAASDVKFMLEMKRRWAAAEIDDVVQSITQDRIAHAVRRWEPPQGPSMAKRDFPLCEGFAQVQPDMAGRPVPRADYGSPDYGAPGDCWQDQSQSTGLVRQYIPTSPDLIVHDRYSLYIDPSKSTADAAEHAQSPPLSPLSPLSSQFPDARKYWNGARA
jgi:exonuclease 3'-5' domain-containing protein 1